MKSVLARSDGLNAPMLTSMHLLIGLIFNIGLPVMVIMNWLQIAFKLLYAPALILLPEGLKLNIEY